MLNETETYMSFAEVPLLNNPDAMFPKVKRMTGNLWLSRFASGESFPTFPSAKTVSGDVRFEDNELDIQDSHFPKLESCRRLIVSKKVGENIRFQKLKKTTEIAIRTTSDSLKVVDFPALEETENITVFSNQVMHVFYNYIFSTPLTESDTYTH